jgi:hypothetical protein
MRPIVMALVVALAGSLTAAQTLPKPALWPQPWTEAKKKDQLEHLLHKLVCDGKVPLKTVQAAIATDWVKAYTKYEGHAP